MKRLRSNRGMTLTETLCAVLIVLLIRAMLATARISPRGPTASRRRRRRQSCSAAYPRGAAGEVR